jgi:putative addiction module component (TIGR02574 family)
MNPRDILHGMNSRDLLAEALQLSPEERAALAAELINSLDARVDPDAEAAWSVEIRQRIERLDSGVAKTVPWSEARRRILAATGRDTGA